MLSHAKAWGRLGARLRFLSSRGRASLSRGGRARDSAARRLGGCDCVVLPGPAQRQWLEHDLWSWLPGPVPSLLLGKSWGTFEAGPRQSSDCRGKSLVCCLVAGPGCSARRQSGGTCECTARLVYPELGGVVDSAGLGRHGRAYGNRRAHPPSPRTWWGCSLCGPAS